MLQQTNSTSTSVSFGVANLQKGFTMRIQDIQDSLQAYNLSKSEQMSTMLSEVFNSDLVSDRVRRSETSDKKPMQNQTIGPRIGSQDTSGILPELLLNSNQGKPLESSASREQTESMSGSREQQETRNRKPSTNGSTEQPTMESQHQEQRSKEKTSPPLEQTPSSGSDQRTGSGRLGALLNEAIRKSLEVRPLHTMPDPPKGDAINTNRKNLISGFDLPEIAPGIKLGKPIDYEY